MTNIEIGKRIKYARDLRDFTLDDIAKKVGVTKSTIQRYEAGKITTIKLPVVESIAIALNVNPAWVVGKSDDMELPSQKVPEIMQYYEQLNDMGQRVATEQVKMLTEVPRFVIKDSKDVDGEFSNELTHHFTNTKDAIKYLKSQNFLAAFANDEEKISSDNILLIANAIYKNNTEG